MSWRLSADALDYSPYDGRTLLVLISLASWADDDGSHIFPRVETLAKKARCSVRQAQRALRQLEQDGVLIVVRKGGGRSLTEYRIDVEKLRAGQGCQNGTGDTTDAQSVDNVTSEVTKSARHIDTRSNTRSSTRSLSQAPAGAGESQGLASLKAEDLSRWPEFRSAVADTWPGGFPADNETACRAEFGKQTRQHDPGLMIDCARLHGRAKAKKQAARGQRGGKEFLKLPANWLREGDWEGYIPQAEAEERQATEITHAIGRVRRTLGEGLFQLMRSKGMHEASIAILDGMTFTAPASFTITKSFQRTTIERLGASLENHLGERPSFNLVEGLKSA